MDASYPLLFEPILKEKVWGGRRLSRLGKRLEPGKLYGESWELADLARTALSGGGGEPARSRIVNGPLAGKTLGEVWGDPPFPLLIKWLDAKEHLSVQVHPSPEYAARHPEAHLKSESWYVLDAEPGSVIFKGVKPGTRRADLERAIADGSVPELLVAVPARPGDCHDLPSGTLHALGAGVLVAEVQTASDTTFRIYDWVREYGRAERELHVEQALECVDLGPPPAAIRLQQGRRRGTLVRTDYFTVEEHRPAAGERLELGAQAVPRVLMVLDGTVEVGDQPLGRGRTALLPEGWRGETTATEAAAVLEVTLPAPVPRSGRSS